jgi:catechol 2,3-dioxygenase-like lactoylglutathione lyase family enzyme
VSRSPNPVPKIMSGYAPLLPFDDAGLSVRKSPKADSGEAFLYMGAMIELPVPSLVPELDVSDLDKSLPFYVGILGFTVRFHRPEERFVYLEREGAHLMLEEALGPGRRFRTAELLQPYGRGVNLQIRASDVIALHDNVLLAGLSLVVDLEERWYRKNGIERGNQQFVVADPDGYLLRFYTDLGSRQLAV